MKRKSKRHPGVDYHLPFLELNRSGQHNRKIEVAPGRIIIATPVFDTYWEFAFRRQNVFFKRLLGDAAPWSDDKIINTHRFTNAFRAADRVSQYLIQRVIYSGNQDPIEVFFRILLFKLFNRIETWEMFESEFGIPTWADFHFERYAKLADEAIISRKKLYSAAYIMPSPPYGSSKKHRNHLQLIEFMVRDKGPDKVMRAKSLKEVFEVLKSYPSIGDFLAFQYSIDINYSEMIDFSENDFVVAGPGAKSGLKKCFKENGGYSEADLIKIVCELADSEFNRLNLKFRNLWGRNLKLIDCQNLFCETDKYSRVAHPEYNTNRSRIKQKYSQNFAPLSQWYPPKWGLKIPKKFIAKL